MHRHFLAAVYSFLPALLGYHLPQTAYRASVPYWPAEEFKTQPVLEAPEVPEIVPEGVPEGLPPLTLKAHGAGEDKRIGDDMFFTRSATAVGRPAYRCI